MGYMSLCMEVKWFEYILIKIASQVGHISVRKFEQENFPVGIPVSGLSVSHGENLKIKSCQSSSIQ